MLLHDELDVNGHILHCHTFVSYLFVFFSFILFFYRRCWDLSAGNLKWIYQVPILVAVVVSTCSAFPPLCWKARVFHSTCVMTALMTQMCHFLFTIKSNMCHYASISLFRLILCYFWTSSESWQPNYGKPTLAGVTPDNSTGTSCPFFVALISSLVNPAAAATAEAAVAAACPLDSVITL